MLEWGTIARDRLRTGPVALVTILATEGSAPRGAGTRMVVDADELSGTIGGGQLEFRAIEQARAVLAHAPGTWRVQDYPLGPLLGQCCGGRVRVLIEHLDPVQSEWLDALTPGMTLIHSYLEDVIVRHIGVKSPPVAPARAAQARGPKPEAGTIQSERLDPPGRPLLLFGAGHVGRAIAARAAGLPFALAWFDTREDAAMQPGVALIDDAAIETCALEAPLDAAVAILTHDHALDYRLTVAALRGPASFVGLIGSRTKRARFWSKLEHDGLAAEAAARLRCPIGLPGIVGNEPEVIAIATLAQLIALAPAT